VNAQVPGRLDTGPCVTVSGMSDEQPNGMPRPEANDSAPVQWAPNPDDSVPTPAVPPTSAVPPAPAPVPGATPVDKKQPWLIPAVAAGALAAGLVAGFATATVLHGSDGIRRFGDAGPGSGFRPGDDDHAGFPGQGLPGNGGSGPGLPGQNGPGTGVPGESG